MDNWSKPSLKRKGEPIANIIFNIIVLFVLGMVPTWHLAFLKPNYMVLLTVLQINCLVQIAGSGMLLVFDPRPLRLLTRAAMEIAGLLVVVITYYLYPFNFSNYHNLGWIDKILPTLLVLAMIIIIGKLISLFLILIFRSGDSSTTP